MPDASNAQFSSDFHTRLRQARRSARLTQGELALAVGISRNAVTHWERHDGPWPTLAHLSRVAQVTGVAFDWLCTGRGHMRFRIGDSQEEPGVLLRYCAQDESEERILLGLRRLNCAQIAAIASLVSSLSSEA